MALTRNDRVRILCTTLLDYLPGPTTWSGQLARSATPGPVTEKIAPCTVCLGRGRVNAATRACLLCPSRIRYTGPLRPTREHSCRWCPACDGAGWRPASRGEEPHDRMTGMPRSELAVAAASPAPIERRHEASELEEGDRLELARRARDRSGSYQELERALELMRSRAPAYYSLVWHVLVNGEPIVLSELTASHLDEAVGWLAGEMRSARVPRSLMETPQKEEARKRSLWRGRTRGHELQRAQRDRAILREREEGMPISRIAREYGLSREHVHRIVRNHGETA